MRRAVVLLILIVLLLAISVVFAQSVGAVSTALDGVSTAPTGGYDLSWWTVDGGGGTLRDGASGYTLSGTAGQADAATWQGQGYALAGGFWGGALPVEYVVYLPLVLRQ